MVKPQRHVVHAKRLRPYDRDILDAVAEEVDKHTGSYRAPILSFPRSQLYKSSTSAMLHMFRVAMISQESIARTSGPKYL